MFIILSKGHVRFLDQIYLLHFALENSKMPTTGPLHTFGIYFDSVPQNEREKPSNFALGHKLK